MGTFRDGVLHCRATGARGPLGIVKACRLLILLAVFLAAALASAQRVDLLTGEVGRDLLCGATLEQLAGELGVPSHAQTTAYGRRLRFVHLGVEVDLDAAGRAVGIVVYALPQGEMHGFHSHFLGPVANGTKQAPVVRLLRGAGLRLERVDADTVRAVDDAYRLEIAFQNGFIQRARLTCAGAPLEMGAPAGVGGG